MFPASGSLRGPPRWATEVGGHSRVVFTAASRYISFVMQKYANPALFLRLSQAVLPWLAVLAVVLLATGLYWGLVLAPADYQQGETVRIMFIHVPAAWMALGAFTLMAVASMVSLIFRHPLADVAARSVAPIGVAFTFIALVSGAIWGKPMWGTWWVWDARLTSVLVLAFLYLGYIALWQVLETPARASRPCAIFALVGFVNVPIIKFSVEWWNTLHQPASVVRVDGPAIHPSILTPLLIMALAFMLVFVVLVLLRMRTHITRQRLQAAAMRALQRAEGGV